jgi:hypothetical protein
MSTHNNEKPTASNRSIAHPSGVEHTIAANHPHALQLNHTLNPTQSHDHLPGGGTRAGRDACRIGTAGENLGMSEQGQVSLLTTVTAVDVRPAFVDDAVALLDKEVAARGGVSGVAIKSAYKVLKGVKPGMVRSSVDSLVEPFAGALQPYVDQHRQSGRPLSEILSEQREQMANSLLAITDARAEHSSHKSLRTAYGKVRGMAHKQVAAAAPGVAELLTKYIG